MLDEARSLRTRSVGWRLTRLVGLMLLGIVILGVSLAANQYRTTRNAVYTQVKRDTATAARSAEQALNNRIQILQMMTASRSVRAQDRAGMKSQFDAIVRRGDAAPGTIGWLDYSDRLSVSSSRSLDDPPLAAADRMYVREVRATGLPFVSEGLRSRVDNSPVFVVAVPTKNDSSVMTGTLIWAIRLDQLDAELAKSIEPGTVVLDRSGRVLFGSVEQLLRPPHPDFDASSFRAKGAGVAVNTTSPSGKRHQIVGYAVAPAGDWLVIRSVAITDGLRDSRKVLGLQLLMLTLASAALLWFGLRTQRELSRSAAQQDLAVHRSEALRILASDLTPATTQVDVRRVLLERGPESVGAMILNVAASDGYRIPVEGRDVPMFVSSGVLQQIAEEWTSLPMAVPTPMRDAYLDRSPVVLGSMEEVGVRYPALVAISKEAGIAASSSFPLFDSQQQTVGAIGFGWQQPQSFDRFQLATLDTVSRLAGQALERAALYDREQAARLQAERLQQFTFDLVTSESVDDVARIIAVAGVTIFGADRATVSAQENGKTSLSLCGSHGYEAHEVPPWATAFLTDKALTLDALNLKRQLLITDLATSEYAHHARSLGEVASTTWLAIPLPVEEFDPTVLVLQFTDGPAVLPQSADDFATRAALGLDRQRRTELSNRAVERSRELAEAVAALAIAETGPQIGAAFAQSVAPLEAAGGFFGIVGQGGRNFEFVFASYNQRDLPLNPALRPEAVTKLMTQITNGEAIFEVSSEPGRTLGLRDLYPSFTKEDGESIRSWCLLPLMTTDRPIGFAVLVFSERQPFDDEQRIELRSYAALCALALSRAQRFEREHEVAVTLQASLLPRIPALIGTTELAGRYRPSTRNVSVGGDWFDAIALDEDRFLLVVGDVVGHGIHSAAAMGKLSTATRALAPFFPKPFELLQQLDAFAAGDPDTRYASMALVLVDIAGATMTTSIAGHPGPLSWGFDNGIREIIAGRGPSLGSSTVRRTQHETLLIEPTTIVMYTDGLTERRAEHIDDRVDILRATINGRSHSTNELADSILKLMLDRDHSDDVALLVVNVEATAPRFDRSVPKDLGELRTFRQELRTWLKRIGASGEPIDDILVAVGEATTNAIEHGNTLDKRPLTFRAERVNTECIFTLKEFGVWDWADDSEHGSPPGPTSHRGRGLALMRQLMDCATIDTANGTTVLKLTKALT